MVDEIIGDLKSFRKNLMIISLSIITLYVYWNRNTEINFLFVKIEKWEIYSWEFSLGLLFLLLFVIWRYYQYYIRSVVSDKINLKLLIIELLNSRNWWEDLVIYSGNFLWNKDIGFIWNQEKLDLNALKTFKVLLDVKEIYTNDEVTWYIKDITTNSNMLQISFDLNFKLKSVNKNEKSDKLFKLEMEFKNVTRWYYYTRYLMFILKEKYFWDYILPFIFWIIAFIFIIYNFYNQITNI